MKKILALPLFLMFIAFSIKAQKTVATTDSCKEKITQAKQAYQKSLKKIQIQKEEEHVNLKKKYAAKNEALKQKYNIDKSSSTRNDEQFKTYSKYRKLLKMSFIEERESLNKKQYQSKESKAILKKIKDIEKACGHAQTMDQKSKVEEKKTYKRQ